MKESNYQIMKKQYWNKGFTLAELLIVVAIIGVLVAISIPIFSGQLEKAREATDAANIRSQYAEVMADAIMDSRDVNKNHTTYEPIQLRQQKNEWQSTGLKTNLEGVFGEVVGQYPKAGGLAWVEYSASKNYSILHYDGENGNTGGSNSGSEGSETIPPNPTTPTNPITPMTPTKPDPTTKPDKEPITGDDSGNKPESGTGHETPEQKIEFPAKTWPEQGSFSTSKGDIYFYNGKIYISAADNINLNANGSPEKGGWYEWNFINPNGTTLTRENVNAQGNIEGGVHRGDLFVDDDGSIYVMSITTEWQNAPKGDEGNWIKIRIN